MWKPKIISDLKAFSGEEWAKIAVERWQKLLALPSFIGGFKQ